MSNKVSPDMAKPSVTVAQKTSPAKESKNKESGKMHRRSRSGMIACLAACSLVVAHSSLQVVSHADCDERNATKARGNVKHAGISA